MTRPYKAECGCLVTDSEIRVMCAPCKAEFVPRHAEAQADYRERENARAAAKQGARAGECTNRTIGANP